MAFVKHSLRGEQGIHHYYLTNLTWGELERLVRFPEDLGELDEDKEMQRKYSKARIGDLVQYLTHAPDHFFSAVTLVMVPRDLNREVEEGEDFVWIPLADVDQGDGPIGTLKIYGTVQLFPADGQHRLRGGFDALKAEAGLEAESLPVVLIPYSNPDQVRQLFADLNLNAKPVNKTVGYSFESRDPKVLAAKSAAEEVELFEGRVNMRSNSLPRSSTNVITLNALVAGSREILDALASQQNPSVGVNDYLATPRAQVELTEVWQRVVDAFESFWQRVADQEPGAAGELRDQYVFPHGLGWQALARVAAELIREKGIEDWYGSFLEATGRIDWSRANREWQGIAMSDDRINNTGPGIKATTDYILSMIE